MSTSSQVLTATTPSVPRRLRVLTGLTALGVTGLLAYTTLLVVEYVTYEGDDPLIGLAVLLAFVTGAPAVLGAILGGAGWLLRRRRPSLAEGLAISGLVLVTLPFVGAVLLTFPTLW